MWGALSDRIGRKPVYLFGAVGVGVWGFAFIALLNTKSFPLAVIGVIVGLLFHGAMYGPQSAFFSELFGTKVRYSGVSIGYQLASIIAGGLAPIIAVKLLKTYGSGTPIAVYVAICALISVVAVVSYRETRDRDLATVTKGESVWPPGDRPPPAPNIGAGARTCLGIGPMSTDPNPALQLLRLLDPRRVDRRDRGRSTPDPEARDLALRIRSAFDARRRREAELTALVDTARDLAALRDPSVHPRRHRPAGARPARHRRRLPHAVRRAGRRHLHARHGRLGVGAVPVGAAQPRRRPRRAGGLDPPAVLDRRLLRRPAVRRTPGRSTPPSATRAWWRSAAPRCWSTRSSSACCSPPTGLPAPSPARRCALLGSLAALAAVSILQTRAAADTAEALERLSEAHAAVHRHTAGVERAAAAHDRFAELVLAGGGVDEITAALAELTGGWVALLDEAGHRLSCTGPAPAPAAGARGGAPRLAAGWSATTACGPSRSRPPRSSLGLPGDRRRAGPGRPGPAHIERAGVVTALLLLFERAAADAEQRMRTDLVSDLVSGRGEAAVRVARARSQGLDLGEEHAVLVARGRPGEPRRALVMSAHAAVGDGALVGEHDGDVVALVPSGDPQQCAGRVAARMGRSAEVTVGAAGPVSSVEDVPRAYADARRTTTALVRLGRTGTGGSADSLGFAGLLSGSAPDVGAYVTRVLGSVLDYDRTRGTDLLGTLEAYYAAGGSPRHAATRLHVHANTVAQRLERVGLLLGSDWQRPEQSLELQLALRLRRLMRS